MPYPIIYEFIAALGIVLIVAKQGFWEVAVVTVLLALFWYIVGENSYWLGKEHKSEFDKHW